MKYFYVKIESPYVGEELEEYCAAESQDALYDSCKIDELICDNTMIWCDADDYEMYGFDSYEDFVEYYISESTVTIREITKEEYEEDLLE